MAKPKYGRQHRKVREYWKPIVEAGQAVCCLCGNAIAPWATWHPDHVPGTADQYRGVAHARCNTSEGATRGNLARAGRRRTWRL